MPSHGSDLPRPLALLIGLALGVCSAWPAHSFTPFSGPILSASPVPPNVVVLLDDSPSMLLHRDDGATRLDIGREATRSIMARNRHLRFGLFGFREAVPGDQGPGGRLLVEVGSAAADSTAGVAHFEALNQALDGFSSSSQPSASAPLAESWYEVTRYLRGMRAFYPQTSTASAREAFASPLEYRCQKNFGLIVTDGLPTDDDQFPDNLLDEPAGDNPRVAGEFNLPDWGGTGNSFYLAEIARFAYDSDLRSSGTDQAGYSWNDPAFPLQNLRTFTLGLGEDDPRLSLVASAGNGYHYSVTYLRQLERDLAGSLREMSVASGSGGGSVSDGQQLSAGLSRYYQTRYDPTDWSGSLHAYQLNATGAPDTLVWSTDNSFLPGNQTGDFQTWRQAGNDLSAGPVTLDQRSWARLSTVQQQRLDAEAQRAGLSGSEAGQRLLNWARGATDADLRSRQRLLGDIIHSAPLLVGGGHHPLVGERSADYAAYLQQRSRAMDEMLLVGANDGFMRLFDSQGRHLYSYLPAAAHSGLGVRARPDYGRANLHYSGVDGRFTVADVRLDQAWATVAAAGLGAGARGLFAVRLFAAGAEDAARGVLWEADAEQIEALGHIYGQPVITQLHGTPVLITGNGYGSAAQRAALLIFDLRSGVLIKQLDVSDRPGAVQANGLSMPVLQWAADGTLQAAFAGDLHGQLWKFELAGGGPDSWRVAHAGVPLFTAAEGQPITVQPSLHPDMTGHGDLLLFGTGKLLEAADVTDTQAQAFYAVVDALSLPAGGLTPAALQAQRLSSATDPVSGRRLRTVNSVAVDWTGQYGWYLPLTEGPQARGERVTGSAVIRHSRVMFTSSYINTVGNDPCRINAGGWLMMLALSNGGMPAGTVLDTNGDGGVDQHDLPAAGLSLAVGLPGDLSVVDQDQPEPGSLPGCSAEVYLVQGSEEVAVMSGLPQCQFNRILWRQLQ